MIFGFGKSKKPKKSAKERDEDEEIELVLFQGATNGVEPILKENAKLVQAGLVRAKQLVSNALNQRAEMIRIEPRQGATVATFMVDGIPTPGEKMSPQAGQAVIQIIKLLAGLDIKVRSKPQSSGINAQFAEINYLLRVDSQPLPGGGERLILRAQNKAQKLNTPDDLGFSDDLKARLRDWTSRRKGVVLGVGMPMSGVTTLTNVLLRGIDGYLYTVYSLTNMDGREIPHVKQFEGNPEDSFIQTCGRAKRAEGDVLFVDPVKTPEYAREVLDEAEDITIVSEMPARDAADAIVKLVEMSGDANLVADRVVATVSQKLIRKLCTKCREAYRPHPKLLAKVGLPPETKVLYRAKVTPPGVEPQTEEDEPCETCRGIGYIGRIALIEAIELTEPVQEVVRQGGDAAAIKQAARKEKMQSFNSDGLRMVAAGITSLEELQRAFKPPAKK